MGKKGNKKKVKVNKLDELPEDLRKFIDGIIIKDTTVDQVPKRIPRKKKEVVVWDDPRKKLINSRVINYGILNLSSKMFRFL